MTFQNKEKFYQQVDGKFMRINQQTDAKDAKQLWSKIWEQKEYSRKAE